MLSSSSALPQSRQNPDNTRSQYHPDAPSVLVIGNSGGGKSTIINTLLGRVEANSGVSRDGKGLTREFREYRVDAGRLAGYRICDTVGWEDHASKQENIDQIRNLLNSGRNFKVVIVVQLHKGRLSHDSVQGIKNIIDEMFRAFQENIIYGLIVNEIPVCSTLAIKELVSAAFDAQEAAFIHFQESASNMNGVLLDRVSKETISDFVYLLPYARLDNAQLAELKEALLMTQACSLIYFVSNMFSNKTINMDQLRSVFCRTDTRLDDVVNTLEDIAEELDQGAISGVDMQKLIKHIDVLKNIKDRNEEQSQNPSSVATLSYMNNTDPSGLVYAVTISRAFKRVILCFRGSVTSEDWYHNIIYLKKKLSTGAKVHEGFFDYLDVKYDEISTRIKQILRQNEHFKLFVTGHSLGGALATLFAYRFAQDFTGIAVGPAIRCISIAAPHVGDSSFKSDFEGCVVVFSPNIPVQSVRYTCFCQRLVSANRISYLRVTTNHDLVPEILEGSRSAIAAAQEAMSTMSISMQGPLDLVSAGMQGPRALANSVPFAATTHRALSFATGIQEQHTEEDYRHFGKHFKFFIQHTGIRASHDVGNYLCALEDEIRRIENTVESRSPANFSSSDRYKIVMDDDSHGLDGWELGLKKCVKRLKGRKKRTRSSAWAMLHTIDSNVRACSTWKLTPAPGKTYEISLACDNDGDEHWRNEWKLGVYSFRNPGADHSFIFSDRRNRYSTWASIHDDGTMTCIRWKIQMVESEKYEIIHDDGFFGQPGWKLAAHHSERRRILPMRDKTFTMIRMNPTSGYTWRIVKLETSSAEVSGP